VNKEAKFMSIIQAHHLESQASTLQKHFQVLQKSQDLLSFFEAVENAQLALSELSSIVRTQEAKFGRCIPTILFLQFFTFFPSSYLYRCQRVCSTWLDLLSSNLSEQILRNLQRSRPQCIYSWPCDYVRRIASYNNQIYVCNLLSQMKVYSSDGILVKEFSTDYLGSGIAHEPSGLVVGSDHIAISWPYYIGLFTPNGKLTQVWKRHVPGENMVIHNKLIYSSIGSEIIVYSLENEMRKKWLASKAPSRIEISDNEIFLLCGGNIEAYSMDGKKK